MITRLSKLATLTFYGLFIGLAGTDNIIDYGSNFAFIQHVMAMDTVFETTTLRWRAIESEALHHVAFALIITTELVAAALCLGGAAVLLPKLRDPSGFQSAKRVGLAGLTAALALFFFGFYVLGGEWFVSWQSPQWSSSDVGLENTLLVVACLIYVNRREHETDP